MFNNLKEDLYVFKSVFGAGWLKYFYYPAFRVIVILRLSQFCYKYKILRPISYFLTNLNDFLHGVWVGPKVRIGKGFSIPHPRGIIIHPGTVIGDYCSMLHQVTIGGNDIVLGNFVEINANAMIINDKNKNRTLYVGDGAVVAAGAVVLSSVDEKSLVAGVPAKHKKTAVENWLEYRLKQ